MEEQKTTAPTDPVEPMVMPACRSDDGLPIDEDWLRTIGFSEYHTATNESADLILKLPESPACVGYFEWLDGRLVLADWLAAFKDTKQRFNFPARTRGEARLTFAVFGINDRVVLA